MIKISINGLRIQQSMAYKFGILFLKSTELNGMHIIQDLYFYNNTAEKGSCLFFESENDFI